jgi:hypothetical protein
VLSLFAEFIGLSDGSKDGHAIKHAKRKCARCRQK